MRRGTSAIVGALLLLGGAAATSGAEADLCAPWTGEVEPLASVSDPDPLRAAWAEYRADQLASAARVLEPRSRNLAHRLWRHAGCLDPERSAFADAVTRTAPVRWVRPPIVGIRYVDLKPGERPPQPVSERPWDLGKPILIVIARIPPPPPPVEPVPERPSPPLPDASEQIAGAEKALREARFELAVEWVERGRRELEGQGPAGQRATLEVLAATAEIALGREAAARESLERALRAEPALSLDPTRHSPKLVRLFEKVRSGQGNGP